MVEKIWRWFVYSLLILGVCLISAAFSRPAHASGNEILIGAPISMTGMFAPDGLEQKWAYEQAVKDWNAKGGIFIKSAGKKLPIKIVFEDDESNPARVADAVDRLVKIDHVDLLLSTHSASLNVAAANAAEKDKVYMHMTAHFPEMWLPQHYKWSSLMFISAKAASDTPFQIWDKLLKPKDRPKRIALLMEDSPDGKGFGDGFRAHAKAHGIKFVVDEPWAIGAKDYSSLILKMKAAHVDAILLYGSPTDAITLVRQIKQAHLNVPYIHGWKGTWPSEFQKALGKDANYIICDGFWSSSFPYPGCKRLGELYHARFHKYSVSIGAFYGCAQTLLMAIQRTQSYDGKVIAAAFRNAEYKGTVMGDLKFDKNGCAVFPGTANQWWHGKQRLFWPAGLSSYKLKLAPAWNNR